MAASRYNVTGMHARLNYVLTRGVWQG